MSTQVIPLTEAVKRICPLLRGPCAGDKCMAWYTSANLRAGHENKVSVKTGNAPSIRYEDYEEVGREPNVTNPAFEYVILRRRETCGSCEAFAVYTEVE